MKAGQVDAVRCLIQLKADANLSNRRGEKPGQRFAIDVEDTVREEILNLLVAYTGETVTFQVSKKTSTRTLTRTVEEDIAADFESNEDSSSFPNNIFRCLVCHLL
mmetsp:Transcript_20257/g.34919  ORF Transcript_20257/g.34919 Transcript_20257/m.34919 type:complete len:105 (+) Transcript_20257:3-317(+)